MRPLRDRLEELSDVILTGHEHTAETFALVRDDASSSLYVSGGVLRDSQSPYESSFVILKLDPKARTRSTVIFRLNEAGFYERTKDEVLQPFAGNPTRIGRPFELRPNFVKVLDELGFVVHHTRKQFLTLPDVFLYPDLLIVDEPTTSANARQIKSRDVATVIPKTPRVLISGGEKAGKTCLAKSLFRSTHLAGYLPILLSGKDIQTRKPQSIRDYVRRAVRDQYSNLQPDQYEQTNREKRLVIIDDFDLMVESAELRTAILKALEQTFGSVVLIGSETFCFEFLDADENRDSHLWLYTHYNILSFGELQREHFVRKWLSLASEGHQVGDVREATAHLTKLINGVIRKTLLPCYPLFLMIVLQQAESGQPTVRGGSYGHLFKSVVTTILNRSKFTKISISAKHRYLATLAYELHQKSQASISIADATAWHNAYWRAIGAPVEFERLIYDFVELNILQELGDRISFRYKYHYCFFVAYYFSENIRDQSIRRAIRQLCGRLYHRETGDILLFWSHLSNDEIVPNEMLNAAEDLLAQAPEADFVKDVASINQLEKTAPKLALPEGNADLRRFNNLEQRDDQCLPRASSDADGSMLSAMLNESDDDYVREALQLPAAFETTNPWSVRSQSC